MTEKIQKEKLASFFKTLKTIYAVKDSMKSMAGNGLLRGINGAYYGSEAISAGICAALSKEDKLVNTCDGIGNIIAKGADLNIIFAEMLGKANGCNGGVRGFLNMTIPQAGIYSANSFSDTQVAMGTGFALAAKIKGEKIVVAAFYNSDNSDEGIIHEAMNIASAFDLPILFVCETNFDANTDVTGDLIAAGKFSKRSIGYDIKGHPVDGMDVEAVYALAKKTIDEIRQSNRPAIIECFIQSFYESFKGNGKDGTESNLNRKQSIIDCIAGSFGKQLLNKNILTDDELKNLGDEAFKLVLKAMEFANNSAENNKEIPDIMYADKYINIPKAGWSV